MESRIALALAEKLRRIYEKDDTYLTYPLGVGFPNRSLGFMKDPAVSGLGAIDQLKEKVKFARNLNIIPNDSPVFSADASEPLWTRTQNILRSAVFAQSGLTPDEEKRLADAIDFLTDIVKLDGDVEVSVNSAILNRFYTYRLAYEAAEAQYLDEKITVETSTGPEGDALKLRWPVREKQLKDALQRALDDFNNLGQANQVKAALTTRNDLELKKHVHVYREAYENEIKIAQLPDEAAGGLPVYTTFFSPYDIFEPQAAWNQLTLTRTELDALADAAVPALKGLFGAEQGVPVDSVTLEYTNVAIVRPWFRPEFFASRTWRFSDTTVVSDGASPRQGLVPGYITSMLAMRNITITRAAGAPATPICIPIIAKEPLTKHFKGEQLSKILNDNPAILKSVEVQPARQVQPRIAARAINPNIARAAVVSPNVTKAVISPNVAVISPAIRAELIKGTTFTKNVSMLDLNTEKLISVLKVKQDGIVVAAPPASTTPPAQPIKPPSPQQERYALDGVVVLAYVCKRVPRSPNPDPSLQW